MSYCSSILKVVWCFPKVWSLQVICIFSQIWTPRRIRLMATSSRAIHWRVNFLTVCEWKWIFRLCLLKSNCIDESFTLDFFKKKSYYIKDSLGWLLKRKQRQFFHPCWYGFLFIHWAPFTEIAISAYFRLGWLLLSSLIDLVIYIKENFLPPPQKSWQRQ